MIPVAAISPIYYQYTSIINSYAINTRILLATWLDLSPVSRHRKHFQWHAQMGLQEGKLARLSTINRPWYNHGTSLIVTAHGSRDL